MATIKDLKSLLSGSRPSRGVVVEVRDASVLVATPGGLREFTGLSGVNPGDQVMVNASGRLTKAAAPTQVYYI